MPDRICVGVIAGAHGVRGLVKVKSFTADPPDVASYGPVWDEAGGRSFRLALRGSAGKGVVLAAIEGVNDRDAVQALKGMHLYVPRSALPEPVEEDEFYWSDLIGLAVVLDDGETVGGETVGEVAEVHDFGAGTMLEVKREGVSSVMLPFTRAAVPVVDVAGGRLVAVRSVGVFDDDSGDADRVEAGGDGENERG